MKSVVLPFIHTHICNLEHPVSWAPLASCPVHCSCPSSSPGILKSGQLCPNANYTKYVSCLAQTKDDCKNGCSWSTRVSGSVAGG
jgi:hypothetical protein